MLVTGAARGVGRAEALALAAGGAQVLVVDVDEPGGTVAAIRAAGGEAEGIELDLTRPGAGDAAVQTALERFGRLDVVVNNAGLVRDGMSFNMPIETFERVVAVNLTATFGVARAAARWWRSRRDEPGDRLIVNTSSESGLYGNAGQANYAAAKAGIAGLTLTLAAELEAYGVRVNAIAPRARTDMSRGAFGAFAAVEGPDPFAPEHVADVVAWLASPAAHGVTGQVLVVCGAELQVLDGWTVRHAEPGVVARPGESLDDRLSRMLPAGARRRVPGPVRDLFEVQA
ncbi:MAG: hypothetical protein V7607_2103 [Solirubrobacteraceae bacterium]